MTQHLNIILPIALVVMALLLKLFMDQSATVPLAIRSLYEAPVNVIFLALSFITAFIISLPANVSIGVCYLFAFLVVMLVVIVLWRRSIIFFERERHFWSAVLFIINGTISGFVLYTAIDLLVTKVIP
jgi:hypothetical protein